MTSDAVESADCIYGSRCGARGITVAPSKRDAENWIAALAGRCLACGGLTHELVRAPIGPWEIAPPAVSSVVEQP